MKANSKSYMTVWLLAVALIAPVLSAAQSKAPESWTKKDLKQAITTAKTAEDHTKIAQCYTHDADRLDAEAKEHAALAETYRHSVTYDEHKQRMAGRTADHCQWSQTAAPTWPRKNGSWPSSTRTWRRPYRSKSGQSPAGRQRGTSRGCPCK